MVVKLQSAFNYQERGMNPVVFTAALDNRYGVGKVTSRIGLQSDAHLFDKQTDIFTMMQQLSGEMKYHCVLVDESQFLTK